MPPAVALRHTAGIGLQPDGSVLSCLARRRVGVQSDDSLLIFCAGVLLAVPALIGFQECRLLAVVLGHLAAWGSRLIRRRCADMLRWERVHNLKTVC